VIDAAVLFGDAFAIRARMSRHHLFATLANGACRALADVVLARGEEREDLGQRFFAPTRRERLERVMQRNWDAAL